ncbi:MAG: UvrB/UvrC motif-containing protein [Halofilum sp. (in: g-proteobacteria)]
MDRQTALRSQLRSLHKRQEKAIAEENYELAAELRDRIEELENAESGEPQ